MVLPQSFDEESDKYEDYREAVFDGYVIRLKKMLMNIDQTSLNPTDKVLLKFKFQDMIELELSKYGNDTRIDSTKQN